MEATGRDGGRGPSWSYRRRREETESSCYTISSSSRSGTIVSSTAYTSGASCSSRLSSGISMEAAALMELELELKLGTPEPEEKDAEFGQPIKKHRKEIEEATLKETRMKRIESLVQEFSRGPSENRSGMSALERWFSELGVSWVLQLDLDFGPAMWMSELRIWSWIHALTRIMETVRLTESFFVGMPGISEKEVDSGKQATTSLDPVQFALFLQETMSKMLDFVDDMLTDSISIFEPRDTSLSSLLSHVSCLNVHRALSEMLLEFRLQFHSSRPADIENIGKEMVSLLSEKKSKVFDAIWSFLEERTRVLKSMEDSLGAETLQGSSYIHQTTCSVMDHIKFLVYHCWKVDPLVVSKALSYDKYVPQTGPEDTQPFISKITEMVSCLEEKLITKSQSFLDKGLGLLFLINNSNFIREQLQGSLSYIELDLAAFISSITTKVEHYTYRYIQVSWEPMLACLFNPTSLRLVRKYSPLSNFESEFQKIHSTQMLWKVPDPELKKRLRKAIIDKIIPRYTKYIEDSKVTNSKFTPQKLEEMLQELFEG